MNIEHINLMTNFPCLGIMMYAGMQWYGNEMCNVYACSLCGKRFLVSEDGQVML